MISVEFEKIPDPEPGPKPEPEPDPDPATDDTETKTQTQTLVQTKQAALKDAKDTDATKRPEGTAREDLRCRGLRRMNK